MKTMNLLCLDPSLNNTGIAVLKIDLETNEILGIEHLFLAATETNEGKTVRKNSSDLRRAREIIAAINTASRFYRCTVACAEVPTGTQSARGSISNGICIGVLAGITLPLIQLNPTEVKLASHGTKTATKEDMVRWAIKRWPDAEWLKGKVENNWKFVHKGKIVHKDNEHLADAVAAGCAALLTEQFKGMVAMRRSIPS